MPQNTHLEIIASEAQRLPELAWDEADPGVLRLKAQQAASSCAYRLERALSPVFAKRCKAVARDIRSLLSAVNASAPLKATASDDTRWLYENVRLVQVELQDTITAIRKFKKMPQVRTLSGDVVPRVLILAESFVEASANEFNQEKFIAFVEGIQETTILDIRELWALISAIKLVLLEQIAIRGRRLLRGPDAPANGIGVCIRSLRDAGQTTWKEVIEPLICFDHVLRQDPAGIYPRMDFDSRDFYRDQLLNIADYSDLSEMGVAQEALDLAREASQKSYADSRVALREQHVGYYLVDRGVSLLHARVGFKYPFGQKIQSALRAHPNACFLLSAAFWTSAITVAIASLFVHSDGSVSWFLLACLALLLPSSQSAVQVTTHLITSLLEPEILPKLDFAEAIPTDCSTLVAIPSLLLGEQQVRELVADLEVRFLGNHDPNLHFALLTDLPDSRESASEDNPLVELCADLIDELNDRYSAERMGSFFLFHRHRAYNPRERRWMGWERKRGKLLDLNSLLRGGYDAFPVKVGNTEILPDIRFVITLDSDTELPRGSAIRMIGTLAHPLNAAIVDPDKNIVTDGYGILQPRVGVSVQSTARSRLAAIYAGETGLDIYTRAVSDVYQDLFKEGIYTGKGIYEVDTLHRVLDRRFPSNALLSHDLIEGAYARAGLISDVEVIEDYPSHYSAYNRRKHRWLRGDWQIVNWLFPRVPDEQGAYAPNPISLISRWKILDNLRRSLVEPATFVLLLLGWLVLPGNAARLTLAAIAILFIPSWCEFLVNLLSALWERSGIRVRESVAALYTANLNLFFTITFLAHQTLVSLDAVVRALVRRFVTHRRLLEWETAAETELGERKPTAIERYLDAMPLLAIGLGILTLAVRPSAFPAALGILALWGTSKLISNWLNRPSSAFPKKPSPTDLRLLRRSALRTWRYFSEFSTEEHNWLIPDNVQEQPPLIAARISPTNLGFLLNARQVACEFGYLTLPEFTEQTLRTLVTLASLTKYRGHLFNWYDTRTLEPLPPRFVSSVDSGNLLASLWSLEQGCRERLHRPLFEPSLVEGFMDCVQAAEELGLFSHDGFPTPDRNLATATWLQKLITLPEATFDSARDAVANSKDPLTAKWIVDETSSRIEAVRQAVRSYAPWYLPEFASLRGNSRITLALADNKALEDLPVFVDKLDAQLAQVACSSVSSELQVLCERLLNLLPEARHNLTTLIKDVQIIAAEAGRVADGMDFTFLLNRSRNLMSVGFDADSRQLQAACYDLLGTESRTAVLVAIAKGDIPQESWFRLGRAHTMDQGQPVLLSWTGTLFEYLMPTLWMRSYSKTLLGRSRLAAVRSQQAYASHKGIPWGISESAYMKLDEAGNYQYYAFGLPHLALRQPEIDRVVISPYSTFLALASDPAGSILNLQRMADMGWCGAYGFYEAIDYGSAQHRFWANRGQTVRCWMAHHQGMSFLALANFLKDNVVQRWFHSERRVQATELLLQEKPVARIRKRDLRSRMMAA